MKVRCLGEWAPTDVEENLKGGTLTKDITALPSTFNEIQDALAQPRLYQVCNLGIVIFSVLTTDHSDMQCRKLSRFSIRTGAVQGAL